MSVSQCCCWAFSFTPAGGATKDWRRVFTMSPPTTTAGRTSERTSSTMTRRAAGRRTRYDTHRHSVLPCSLWCSKESYRDTVSRGIRMLFTNCAPSDTDIWRESSLQNKIHRGRINRSNNYVIIKKRQRFEYFCEGGLFYSHIPEFILEILAFHRPCDTTEVSPISRTRCLIYYESKYNYIIVNANIPKFKAASATKQLFNEYV